MAAPIVNKSRDSNLQKLIVQEKADRKITKKNILCPKFQDWPRPSKDVSDQILAILSKSLETLPNIFKSAKNSSEADQEAKNKTRSQLVIGVSSVFRAIETDSLSCALVSGQANPAAIVDHVIGLARERGCPLLCLDALSTTVASATKTKAFPLCIGFKKSADPKADFAEVISLICKNSAISARSPEPSETSSLECTKLEELPAEMVSEHLRPISVPIEREDEIMGELKSIFSRALVDKLPSSNHSGKKKKKKPKGNLKELFNRSIHAHFDLGKRTCLDTLERGKLQLLLVTRDILPFLLTEAPSSSLLRRAAKLACPVVCLPDLNSTFKSICGANVSVLGFKKYTSLPPKTEPLFKSIIEKCLHILRDAPSAAVNTPNAEMQTALERPVSETKASSSSDLDKSDEGDKRDKSKPGINNSDEDDDDEEEEEEEDFSHLYILKKDSPHYQESMKQLQRDIEALSKEADFSGDFISLDSSAVLSSEVSARTDAMAAGRGKTSLLGKRKKTPATEDELTPLSKTRLCNEAGQGAVTDLSDIEMSNSQSGFEQRTEEDSESRKAEERGDVSSQNPMKSASGFISFSDGNQKSDAPENIAGEEKSVPEETNRPTSMEFDETVISNSMEGKVSTANNKGDREENANHALENISSSPMHTPPSEKEGTSPLFTISRIGDTTSFGEKRGKSDPKVDKNKTDAKAATNQSSGARLGLDQILGGNLLAGKETRADKEAEHVKQVFSVVRSQGTKKNLKRQQLQQSADGGFVSFAYTEANIQTLVNDVSKKKKKKKKKK